MLRITVLCVTAFALVACAGKGVTDSTTPPVVPDTTTTPGGTVQRTSLTVRVQVDPADAALASTAGVTVAGLAVRLSRAGVNEAPRVATTDANGAVRFDALLDGQYTASVERALSAGELARLAPTDRDASIFAGGSTTVVSPPNAPTTTLSLVAARRGSLVISEFFNYYGSPTIYNWGRTSRFTTTATPSRISMGCTSRIRHGWRNTPRAGRVATRRSIARCAPILRGSG